MTTVYPSTLVVLFAPLGGMADQDPDDIDPELQPEIVDEKTLKHIYEQHLKPHYVAMKPQLQDAIKTMLRLFLYDEDIDHKGQLEGLMLSFGHPESPKNAFWWLWEVLFPGETALPLSGPIAVVENINGAEVMRRISLGRK
jgi:hypothetical protein